MRKTIGGIIFEMEAITSKYLSYIGHDAETGTLAIEFVRGPAYFYQEVPRKVFDRLRNEKDPDAFFDAQIKNSFRNSRVG